MTAVQKLLKLVDADDRYAIPLADLLPVQLEAARERLARHGAAIRLVRNRVEETGVKRLEEPADLIPLLFAHTAYKSYPESWLEKNRWELLNRWLDTVSAMRTEGVDSRDVADIDEWITRLAAKGQFVSCSSGTSGKVSMIPSSMLDRQVTTRNLTAAYSWATGLPPGREHKLFICHPQTNNLRFLDSWDALNATFGREGEEFRQPGEPVTIGRIREMVRLRMSIKQGSARPAEIADYERRVAERERMIDGAVRGIAEALVAARGRKIMIAGMYAQMFKVAQLVREMGYGEGDFDPDNAMMVSGGLKGAELPPDYRERIMRAFHIGPLRAFSMYGMQELNTLFPRCRAGRYHVAPWVVLLVLDEQGEKLVGPPRGELEGRAGFFDLSHENRWGGLLSGDKITVEYGKCACGHEGPTIGDNIVRYADLPGGDKISCAGSIDAYVRGAT